MSKDKNWLISISDFLSRKKKPEDFIRNIYNIVFARINTKWREYVESGKNLNELVSNELGITVNDCIHDLNEVHRLEFRYELPFRVFGPHALSPSQFGFIAGFEIYGQVYMTPELLLESYARSFNILLFVGMRKLLEENDSLT